MKVYHGSYMSIEQIDLSKCEKRRDFGRGFYVTNILEQADFWAKRKGIANKTKGFVTEFDFDEEAFEDNDLQVFRFEEYNEAWLDFVVSNRQKRSKAHPFDIVEGPVADDDITQRIDAYLEGVISKTEFLEELKFHRPTHQIAFCTIESLQMLERIKKKKYVGNIDDAITQSLVADYGMTVNKAIDVYFESKTYKQLIDETTNLCNKPWEEIYKLILQELKLKK
jgi:hypothetical protein